ncbi:hypothetical protein FGO68_gene8298 [Halteria grandinella]|uniref:Uncharacterized protein n=1 Tax=Halteria grandinella TaxID=5974 RepID=A0A8J8NP82_HALGN|nr:hypothetical protein FGO68_gene8298 [Halteria grandinella]
MKSSLSFIALGQSFTKIKLQTHILEVTSLLWKLVHARLLLTSLLQLFQSPRTLHSLIMSDREELSIHLLILKLLTSTCKSFFMLDYNFLILTDYWQLSQVVQTS